MNPDEVFALLQRADPAATSEEEVMAMPRHVDRSKSWVRPVLVLAAAALAVVLAFGPLGLLGGDQVDVLDSVPTSVIPLPDESMSTVPETASESMSGPSTTVPDSTVPDSTVPNSTVPDSTVPGETSVGFLLADGEAVYDASSGNVVADRPAVVVYDDLKGGLVYQQGSSIYFGDVDGTDVWHLPAGTSEPVAVMEQNGDATLRLLGVFDVEGEPIAMVVERRNPGDVEGAVEVMYEVAVTTGAVHEVAQVGGWESGPAAISWDGSTYVISSLAEGYSFLETVDRTGVRTPWPGVLRSECFDEPECPRNTVATADGTKLVFTRGITSEATTLVVWDRLADEELWSVELGPGAVLGPPAVVGDVIVINRYREGEPGVGRAAIVDLISGDVADSGAPGFVDPVAQP